MPLASHHKAPFHTESLDEQMYTPRCSSSATPRCAATPCNQGKLMLKSHTPQRILNKKPESVAWRELCPRSAVPLAPGSALPEWNVQALPEAERCSAVRGASGCLCSPHIIPDCFPALWQSLGGFFQHKWRAPSKPEVLLGTHSSSQQAKDWRNQLQTVQSLKPASNCAFILHRVKLALHFPLQDQLPISSRCQQTRLAFSPQVL